MSLGMSLLVDTGQLVCPASNNIASYSRETPSTCWDLTLLSCWLVMERTGPKRLGAACGTMGWGSGGMLRTEASGRHSPMSGLHNPFTQGMLGLLALSRKNSDAETQESWRVCLLEPT